MDIESDINESDEISFKEDILIDENKIVDRVKEFSYYLIEEVEANLDLCLKLIEDKQVPVKPNSKCIFILSKITSIIPKVGGGLGSALSQTENFFLNRIDKKNSRTLADLVYFFSDNRDGLREILIEASVDVFCSFEDQFRRLTCEGGERRAMQKLAKTASGRIFNYLLDQDQLKEVTKKDFIRGILEGDSKTDRTVKVEEKDWKTSDIFRKTGLVVLETSTFYKKRNSRPEKYRHRKPFQWETNEEIEKTFEIDNTPYEIPKYVLIPTEELLSNIRRYILMKDPFGKEQLGRESDVEKIFDITTKQYEDLLQTLKDNYQEVIQEIQGNYCVIVNNQQVQTSMLETVLKNQYEDKNISCDIGTKLELIHKDVVETKENQNVITSTTTEIKEEIGAIKLKQQELSETVVNPSVILRQILKENDPGPSIKKEVERTIERTKKEAKRFEKRFKKIF